MRRYLFLVACAAVVLAPGAAEAKGAEKRMYVPGERWSFQSDVVVSSADRAARAATVPHYAYLEPIPDWMELERMLVATVELDHLDPGYRYLRYRVSFLVPDVPAGRYRVLLCDAGCRRVLGGVDHDLRLSVMSTLERRLRMVMTRRFEEIRDRVSGLRNQLAAEAEGRDIRQRYQATRSLELARRVEALESKPASGRGPIPALWLVGLGFAAGIAASSVARAAFRAG